MTGARSGFAAILIGLAVTFPAQAEEAPPAPIPPSTAPFSQAPGSPAPTTTTSEERARRIAAYRAIACDGRDECDVGGARGDDQTATGALMAGCGS